MTRKLERSFFFKQDQKFFNHGYIEVFFTACKWDTWTRYLNIDFTIGGSLFGAV